MNLSLPTSLQIITVLLIDDQPIISETVQRMLRTETDMRCYYCQDPLQAIDFANQIQPTVILQDLVMPEIEGLTLLRYFRVNPTTREVPMIVLSSKEQADIKAEAFALGANDYMVKLPERAEFIARLRYHAKGYINLLERNQAYQQLEIANRFIRKAFGRYLSDEIVNNILASPDGLTPGGEKRLVTAVMTDLRGFTSICEHLAAEQVVNMLNTYVEVMTRLIMKYQGTIENFIGDSILAIFGAPVRQDNDAERAVACALEMQLAMQEVNQRNQAQGYPEISMGIGINTGELVVGNIGSSQWMKYGVVGHTANLTARVESYTVGGQILASEHTLQACPPDSLRVEYELEVMPKGVRAPLKIYEITGIKGEFNFTLHATHEAQLQELAQIIDFHFNILEGKQNDTELYPAQIIKLSKRTALIQSSRTCRPLTNLRLHLQNTQAMSYELYAKVTRVMPEDSHLMVITFTSIAPEVQNLFNEFINEIA